MPGMAAVRKSLMAVVSARCNRRRNDRQQLGYIGGFGEKCGVKPVARGPLSCVLHGGWPYVRHGL